jgi:hypothetical protein
MVRTHQPGQTNFRSILTEDVDWKPFPAFPPPVRLAVLVGDPSQPGPYVIRGVHHTSDGDRVARP